MSEPIREQVVPPVEIDDEYELVGLYRDECDDCAIQSRLCRGCREALDLGPTAADMALVDVDTE